MGKVLWGITGAGHWMRESARIAREVARRHEVTVIMTKNGASVAKLYGVFNIFKEITGGYYRELEIDPSPLSHVFGRIMNRKYDVLVVAPATANTVAKTVYGIADNLVTTAMAMARKSGVRTLVMPTDAPWVTRTTLPCVIEKCVACKKCPPQEACPENAIDGDKIRRILLNKCIGCEACVGACPYNAISCFKEVPITLHWLDMENAERLKKLGFEVVRNPEDLRKTLEVILD